jgi:hypothetical protein
VRNDVIRQIVGTTPSATYIERQKIKWFGHLVRMQQHQLPAQALYQRRFEVRARGRPRRRWIDDIKDIVEIHGMTIINATHRELCSRSDNHFVIERSIKEQLVRIVKKLDLPKTGMTGEPLSNQLAY